MRLKAQNPWGRQSSNFTFEPQRSDLWVVDLTSVINSLKDQSYAQTVDDLELENLLNFSSLVDQVMGIEDALFFATSVSISPATITPEQIMQHTVPYNVPGYDVPHDSVKIDFIHDIPRKNSNMGLSKIYSLLQAWRMLVRTGRSTSTGEQTLVLNTAKDRPKYSFDIPVVLLRGLTRDEINVDSNDTSIMVSSVYHLKKCWLSSIQLSDLNRDTASIHKVSATIVPSSVIPIDANTIQFDTPLNVYEEQNSTTQSSLSQSSIVSGTQLKKKLLLIDWMNYNRDFTGITQGNM